MDRYGFEEGPATEYFSLHAELDHEHAAQSRELIEERLADADLDRLLEVAEGVAARATGSCSTAATALPTGTSRSGSAFASRNF